MRYTKGISFTSVAVPALLLTIALMLSLFVAWQVNFSHREKVIKHEIAVNFASDKWTGFHSGDVNQCVLVARFDKNVPCTAR